LKVRIADFAAVFLLVSERQVVVVADILRMTDSLCRLPDKLGKIRLRSHTHKWIPLRASF
jgi:hypothetical protein